MWLWKWQKPAIGVGLRARASVKKQGGTVVFKGQANGRGPWWRVVLIEKGGIVWRVVLVSLRWCKRRKSIDSIKFGDWWDWLLIWSVCVCCCWCWFQNFHRLSWTIFPSVHVPLTVLWIWVCLFGAPPFLAISSSTPTRLRVYFSPQTHLQVVPSNCSQTNKPSNPFCQRFAPSQQTQWHRKRETQKEKRKERKKLTVLWLVRQKPWGQRGIKVAPFYCEEKIRWNGNAWSHVLVDESLMFKLLPLWWGEGKPVPSIHHQAKRVQEEINRNANQREGLYIYIYNTKDRKKKIVIKTTFVSK